MTVYLPGMYYTSEFCFCISDKEKSCLAYHDKGIKASGMYYIDPDEDGVLTGFTVYCDMSVYPPVTVVYHTDNNTRKTVDGFEAAGSYVFQVNKNYFSDKC